MILRDIFTCSLLEFVFILMSDGIAFCLKTFLQFVML